MGKSYLVTRNWVVQTAFHTAAAAEGISRFEKPKHIGRNFLGHMWKCRSCTDVDPEPSDLEFLKWVMVPHGRNSNNTKSPTLFSKSAASGWKQSLYTMKIREAEESVKIRN